jgi:hypothetical protein
MSFVDIAILHFLLFALSRTEAFLATLTMKEWGFSEFLGAFQRAFAMSWSRTENAASAKAHCQTSR